MSCGIRRRVTYYHSILMLTSPEPGKLRRQSKGPLCGCYELVTPPSELRFINKLNIGSQPNPRTPPHIYCQLIMLLRLQPPTPPPAPPPPHPQRCPVVKHSDWSNGNKLSLKSDPASSKIRVQHAAPDDYAHLAVRTCRVYM